MNLQGLKQQGSRKKGNARHTGLLGRLNTLLAAGVMAAVVLAAASCSSANHTATPAGSTRSHPTFVPSRQRNSSEFPSVSGSGTSIRAAFLHDISFVTASSGWALVEGSENEVVAHSSDGGMVWNQWGSSIPGGGPGAFSPSLVVMGNVSAASGSGGLYGVVSFIGSSEIFVSNNGLRSWHAVSFPGDVLALAADPVPNWHGHLEALAPGMASQPLWVLFGPLPYGETALQKKEFGPPGSLGIGLLYPRELAWKPYGAVAGPTWPARSTITYARFIRLGAGNGFVVFGGLFGSGGAGSYLEETNNYGLTWQMLPVPCAALPDDFSLHLSVVSSRDLWLGCAGQPGAGSEIKAIYNSTDGGRSWSKVWDGFSGNSSGLSMTAGYLNGVVGLSGTEAYAVLGRGPLIWTTDGGKSWVDAIPHIGGSGGILQLDVLDSTNAWALVGGGRLWATSNGRTWHQLVGPAP